MSRAALTAGGADDHVDVHGVPIYGLPVDMQTRCVHYDGPSDVIAIRFRCCDRFHPCHTCHHVVADHPVQLWAPEEQHAPAVLCGVCGHQLPIERYFEVDACPDCGAMFNPGCRLHRNLYFG